jgi:nitroimidazol reductase NimA-like FMN-containing flavoprotein (pyridoxamine 5'-phosphate oxidase superfamily)
MHLDRKYERFLKGLDTCRLATVGPDGYPHCVPVGYVYHDGLLYMPTVAGTKKARNIEANPKACVTVDTLNSAHPELPAAGLTLQGKARLVKEPAYSKLKVEIERLSGWRLDDWRIGSKRINGKPPDSIIVFTPSSVAEFGRL